MTNHPPATPTDSREERTLAAVPSPIRVRALVPDDRTALTALVDRCSPETLYRRFHAGLGPMAHREVGRLLHPDTVLETWVAEAADALRGTASLGWGGDGLPEAAFLVEDAWFRRGVGRALFRAVADRARAAGAPLVVANVQAENARVRRFLSSLAPRATAVHEGGGDLRIEIPVLAHPSSHRARLRAS